MVVVGLLFVWLILFKLIARVATLIGKSAPCPAAMWWLLDNPIRRRYVRLILDRIGIEPGERVLELGPGPGAFTVDAARRAGPDGGIIAVDIQSKMVTRLERRIQQAGIANVRTIIGNAHDLPLQDDTVDRAFLVTVLPEIPDKAAALAEIRRVLRRGGILSVTEDFSDPDYLFASETTRLVETAGFVPEGREGNVWLYSLRFRQVSSARDLREG